MEGAGNNDGRNVFQDGYVIPITGLLSILFMILAGGTAYSAFTSGSIGVMTLPVIFGSAGLYCLRLRQRYIENTEG
ncbi:MAG: hypothetical protein V5A55_03395 [Halovenus sp.]